MRISRRQFLGSAVAGATATSIVGCDRAFKQRLRNSAPSVVLVTLDTTRFDRMGFNGYGRATTPFLDAMAQQGVNFSRVYSQAGITTPSIASLMTARDPRSIGIRTLFDVVPKEVETLAQSLKASGYQTIGATSVPFLGPRTQIDKGFDAFNCPEPSQVKRPGDKTLDRLLNLLKRIDEARPFFCWMHLYDPHIPYVAPRSYTELFPPHAGQWEMAARVEAHLVGKDDPLDGEVILTQGPPFARVGDEEINELNAQYDGQIAFADLIVENLMAFLSRRRIFDNQRDLFVLTSDHGELMGEHGWLSAHIDAFDEINHVPMFMSGAGLPSDRKIEALAANLDVSPTIQSILTEHGVELSEGVGDGKSLLDALDGRKTVRTSVISDIPDYVIGKAIRDGRHRLLIREEASQSPLDVHEGYSPSGLLEFQGEVTDSIEFTWPETTVADENARVRFTLVKVKHGASWTVMEETLPYSASTLCVEPQFMKGESMWNWHASYDHFTWSVALESLDGDVYFTSDEISFRLVPTENFQELFDLETDPGETNNLIRDPEYDTVRHRLKELLAPSFEVSRHIQSETTMTEEEREALESIGYVNLSPRKED